MNKIIYSVLVGLALTGCSEETELAKSEPTSIPSQKAACSVLPNEDQLSNAQTWKARAQCDLIAGHNIMLVDHPGPVDPLNPEFMEVANKAILSSLKLAEKVKNASDYNHVLRAYSAAFKDGHFQLKGTKKLLKIIDAPNQIKWAGFMIGWREEKFSVVYADKNSEINVGDELISCDGIQNKKLMRENVFAFSSHEANNPANWAMSVNQLIENNGNSFIPPFKSCKFTGVNGEKNVVLKWQNRPANYQDKLLFAQFGEKPQTGLKEIAPDVWWINASDFSPKTAEATDKIHQLTGQIEKNRNKLRAAKAIVFDTRGNHGGNSVWGNNYLRALYGKAYFDSRTYRPEITIDWRVNQQLVDHLTMIREKIGIKENSKGIVEWVDTVLPGMKAALKANKAFYSEKDNKGNTPPKKVPNPVNAKVYLFTHGWCASSCLAFADGVLAMEGTKQIGYNTGSDTTYMEVKHGKLPSGYGRILVPLKVIRNRPRGSRVFYVPNKIFNGYNWTNERVQNWFLNAVLLDGN